MDVHTGFLTVDYDDGDAKTFKGLILTYGENIKKFDTGDPLIDWYNFHKFIYGGDALNELISNISCSSSVGHWFMDGNEYIEQPFKISPDGNIVFLDYQRFQNIPSSGYSDVHMCVIRRDMKSFQELKDYVNSKTVK